jgi:hypothetical protein
VEFARGQPNDKEKVVEVKIGKIEILEDAHDQRQKEPSQGDGDH